MLWKDTLRVALKLIRREEIHYSEWTWGGGSALAFRICHRESVDVDIFFWNAMLLTRFSPRLNDYAEEISKSYTEQSNFIKLYLLNGRQIDFILSPALTSEPYTVETVLGERIQVETPWEIVIKKLFYRAESLKVRDVIDTVAVWENYPEEFERELEIVRPKKEIIKKRLEVLKKVWDREVETLTLYNESLRSVVVPQKFGEIIATL
jgi:hypothetical protein